MAADKSYGPANYRKTGGRTMVIGGNLNTAAGVPGEVAPTTGTLITHVTSATIAGNDFAGTITLVIDATGVGANAGVCTVTFGTPYANAPVVILSNMSPGSGSATTYTGSYGATSTTTTFVLDNLAALTASSTVIVGYQVLGVE